MPKAHLHQTSISRIDDRFLKRYNRPHPNRSKETKRVQQIEWIRSLITWRVNICHLRSDPI
uniref:Uncharacterized protein n=1 Tax=Brassica oleracea TaxID=3712 RepID=A0A3P6GGD6_BRAOL|nr:unnamed protein product [Brassica oleracea]